MTHSELVHLAAIWLRKHHRCSVVFTEMVTRSDIIPDAIGWRVDVRWSILIECKISRADFCSDRSKRIHLDPENAPGQERWYLVPPGLVTPEEVPEGWFLAEAQPSGKIKKITKFKGKEWERPVLPMRSVQEVPYLLSALRRHDLG